jgi:hypothetical protein
MKEMQVVRIMALIVTMTVGVVAQEERSFAVMDTAVMASSVNTALIPVPLEQAGEMGGLRLVSLVGGLAALGFTFYQALGRRPNSARR